MATDLIQAGQPTLPSLLWPDSEQIAPQCPRPQAHLSESTVTRLMVLRQGNLFFFHLTFKAVAQLYLQTVAH